MTIDRIYSQITVKSVSEDAREIVGIATTVGTDRDGDIVEPSGAQFTLPVPLLWQHDRMQPIGQVTAAKLTKDGIEIRAQLVKPEDGMPAQMVARLNEAWASIKSRLVRGLSVGFQPLEYAFMDNGGLHVTKWDWHELSAVTVPANTEATITLIKSLDKPAPAGASEPPGHPAPSPDSTGKTKAPASSGFFIAQTKGQGTTMNIQEQIKALAAKAEALKTERVGIQEKAVGENRTKSAEESQRFAAITTELAAIDAEIKDLQELEKTNITKAAPVPGTPAPTAMQKAAYGSVSVTDNRIVGQGLAVAQMARLLHKAQGNLYNAAQMAQQDDRLDPRVGNLMKAAVAAGTTSSAAWAGNLVGNETSVYADFAEFLRPKTIVGQFGQGGIPALRSVPFRTALLGQTVGASGAWVGEGKPIPVTAAGFSRTTLAPAKVGTIAAVTKELLESSSPSADALLRDELADALQARMDIDFINPAKAAVAETSPASILNGVTAIPSTGTDADAVRADIKALFAAFIAANNTPETGVFVMPSTTALALSLMRNALGQKEFPEITMLGGKLEGLPVLVSQHVPAGVVALVNASDIYLGDEGGFEISLSTEAAVQMDGDPTTPDATTVLSSFFQLGLVGFRVLRTVSWARRRASAVAHLSGVAWA